MPSRARAAKCARFFDAYRRTGAVEPGLLMIEQRDVADYSVLQLPPNWTQCVVPESLAGKKFNDGAMVYAPGEDCYFLCADDLVPETPHWDAILKKAAGAWGVASADDGIQRDRIPIHPCIGGEFVRGLGYLANPLFGHFYWDNVLGDLAEALGVRVYLGDVKMPHLHHSITGERDKAWGERGLARDDQKVYEAWRENGFQEDLDRLKRAYARSRVNA